MKLTIKGLKALDQTKVMELLEDCCTGDILASGVTRALCELCLDPKDEIVIKEAEELNSLLAAMLAADRTHGLAFYGKFWLGRSEEDLRPDLENTDFESDDAIYIVISTEDPKIYHSWVKKLGQWHLCFPSRPDTLCGKPMLGNNYTTVIRSTDREKCEECFALINEDVDKIHG